MKAGPDADRLAGMRGFHHEELVQPRRVGWRFAASRAFDRSSMAANNWLRKSGRATTQKEFPLSVVRYRKAPEHCGVTFGVTRFFRTRIRPLCQPVTPVVRFRPWPPSTQIHSRPQSSTAFRKIPANDK